MALKMFKHKFIAFLHAPMDQDGITQVMIIPQWALNQMSVDPECDDDEDLLLSMMATQEKIREAIIAFVLVDFYGFGIDRYSLDVLLNGWQAFVVQCGCIADSLYSIITGS
jgi:hypothetical protein